MNISGEYDKNLELIVVKLGGLTELKNADGDLQTASKLSVEHNCMKVLFDARELQPGQSLLEGYEGAKNFGTIGGLSKEHICAILYDPKTYPEERAEFLESIIHNWDNPNIRVFRENNEAFNWLKDQ